MPKKGWNSKQYSLDPLTTVIIYVGSIILSFVIMYFMWDHFIHQDFSNIVPEGK